MSTSPANFHDWQYERESEKEFKRDMEKRANEIADEISERILDLEMSSGHGNAEQALMGRVLMDLCEKEIAWQAFRTYLFKLWKHRNAYDDEERKKISRAAQAIANMIAPMIRDIVSSDVHKEFGA
jgi:signal recognition particle GTPase